MLKFSFYPQFLISEYLRDFIYLFLITKQSQNSLKFLKLAEITSRSDVNKYKIKFSNQSTEAEKLRKQLCCHNFENIHFSVQSADLSHNALFAS